MSKVRSCNFLIGLSFPFDLYRDQKMPRGRKPIGDRPMSSKERKERYNRSLEQNPEKKAEQKRLERERWHRRVAEKKVKLVDDCSEREKRRVRKNWRDAQKRHNARKKDVRAVDTPPATPEAALGAPQVAEPGPSVQRGRPRVTQQRSKTYRDMLKYKSKLESAKKNIQKYRMRLVRSKKKSAMDENGNVLETPRRKADKILGHSKKAVRRRLVLQEALISELREWNRNKKKPLMALRAKVVKKYRMGKWLREELDLDPRRFERKLVANAERLGLSKELKEDVRRFYEQDNVSRMTSGKKETVTLRKEKRQKRYLLDTLGNLHKRYLSEKTEKSISYASFCRLRPFHVRIPDVKSRDTCLCKICDNAALVASKLKNEGVIETVSIRSLLKQSCCNPDDELKKDCCYGDCQQCQSKNFEGKFDEVSLQKPVKYEQWETVKKAYMKDGKMKEARAVEKVEKTATVEELSDELIKRMKTKLGPHMYRISHQYLTVREIKQKLGESEALIHIDFAENWSTKLASEIMSKHFGASQVQVTMHNGVAYLPNGEQFSFSTLSDSNRHDACAIWAYLDPVLRDLREQKVTTLLVNSDGPTTQYRNRTNFFLMNQQMKRHGFKKINWSFSEAGHGKGPVDGVGAALKRAADRLVAHGANLPDAMTTFTALKDTGLATKLHFVSGKEIEQIEEDLPLIIPSIAGTMSVHQVFSAADNTIKFRALSCFCRWPQECECHDVSTHSFAGPQDIHPIEEAFTEKDLGSWVLVTYHNQAYPGRVVEVDEDEDELCVHVLHSVGLNRWRWPTQPDKCWYTRNQFISIMGSPPIGLNRQQFKLDERDWDKLDSVYFR